MKNILILAMSCNQDFFIREEELVRETYAKRILDKEFEHIDFWSYSASLDDKIHINKKLHRIEVPCDDSLKGTYQKTIKTFKVQHFFKERFFCCKILILCSKEGFLNILFSPS